MISDDIRVRTVFAAIAETEKAMDDLSRIPTHVNTLVIMENTTWNPLVEVLLALGDGVRQYSDDTENPPDFT